MLKEKILNEIEKQMQKENKYAGESVTVKIELTTEEKETFLNESYFDDIKKYWWEIEKDNNKWCLLISN